MSGQIGPRLCATTSDVPASTSVSELLLAMECVAGQIRHRWRLTLPAGRPDKLDTLRRKLNFSGNDGIYWRRACDGETCGDAGGWSTAH